MNNAPPISAPAHGGQLRQIALRFGVDAAELLDFSANINPAGPPASVMEALQQSLTDPAKLTVYPDLELAELKNALAISVGVLSENVAAANGFVPLLEAALRALKVSRCLLPIPSFSEYRRTLENAGATVVPYHLLVHEDISYDPFSLSRALVSGQCDSILLANPQNPSGVVSDARAMQHIVAFAKEHGVMVLLDEAFVDYLPKESLTRHAIEISNLVVFRSVTKFFAVPGLRVAYAVSQRSLVERMNQSLAPWPVTSFASDAICAAIRDERYAEVSRTENSQRRDWLRTQLEQLEIVVYPSATNFLLLRFPAEIDVSLLWTKMIVEEHIVLRSCTNFEGLTAGHLRVAVRSQLDNEKLIRGLERVLLKSHQTGGD